MNYIRYNYCKFREKVSKDYGKEIIVSKNYKKATVLSPKQVTDFGGIILFRL